MKCNTYSATLPLPVYSGSYLQIPVLQVMSEQRNNYTCSNYTVEEVSQNMYCISSVIEYIIMEVSQNIPIYSYSVTLAYNGISIIIYLKTPALECIFSDTWSWSIFSDTSSSNLQMVIQKTSFYKMQCLDLLHFLLCSHVVNLPHLSRCKSSNNWWIYCRMKVQR